MHKVVNHGISVGRYVSRYVIDFQIIPTATELRFYADAVELYSDGVVSNDRICGFINSLRMPY